MDTILLDKYEIWWRVRHDMPYCRECGNEIQEDWVSCPLCGAKTRAYNVESKNDLEFGDENLMERVRNIGEATGPKPTEKLVKPPEPDSNPRQKSMSQLLTRPLTEFNYVNDIFGTVYYELINDNEDYVTYIVKVRGNDNELIPRWTALVWVFKRECEYNTELMDMHKLSTPERVIHTNTAFTCKYMRKRGKLDYILNGFEKHFGLAPYSAL